MTLTDIDAWIGKTLFLPPIIKLCQVTHQSQHAVSRLFWFVAALDGFYRATDLISSVLFGGMSLVMMVTASLRADMPTRSSLLFRMLALAFLFFDLIKGATLGDWKGTEFWVLVLAAEYASTIRTIPPAKVRESRTAATETGLGS
jgi:hypothetical protein